MFTGIITDVGEIVAVEEKGSARYHGIRREMRTRSPETSRVPGSIIWSGSMGQPFSPPA